MSGADQQTLIERYLPIAFWVTVVVVGAAFVWPSLAPTGSPTYVDVGQWLSGIVQPVAVFWFILALLLQREELRLQRKELAETRLELKRQADAARGSERASNRAVFVQLKPAIEDLLQKRIRTTAQHLRNLRQGISFEERADWLSDFVVRYLGGGTPDPNVSEWLKRAIDKDEGLQEARNSFVATMNALFDAASKCDEDEGPVYVDIVRSTSFYAWYMVLQELKPANDLHPAAEGVRPNDERKRKLSPTLLM